MFLTNDTSKMLGDEKKVWLLYPVKFYCAQATLWGVGVVEVEEVEGQVQVTLDAKVINILAWNKLIFVESVAHVTKVLYPVNLAGERCPPFGN